MCFYNVQTKLIFPILSDFFCTCCYVLDFLSRPTVRLLVMSNIYNIPHLRLLCVNRLSKELDVEHACIIWYCAGLANEEWLRRRAASFCLTNWGRIVRTQGFLRLPRSALVELSQEIDSEGRVIGGEELEYVDGMHCNRFDDCSVSRKHSVSSERTQALPSDMDDSEGMDMA